ncbi:MAG: DinB family protein [Verrucomicrobiota bacterium]|nr:DinB family protein [Verrucomicrobiota bacterium]
MTTCGCKLPQREFLPAATAAATPASMKHTFLLALLSAAACAASALGQTSSAPAPVASASASPSDGTITAEERERAIDYLKETEKNFLASIDAVSDAQWKFKAAPDRWSIAETAEHIATSESFIWARIEEMMKAPANPERRAETQGKDQVIFDKIPDRSRKAKAPEPLKPTGKFATREELVKQFREVRAKEIALLENAKADLRNHIADNPALDAMDAYQWVIFNGAHSKRHTAQIEEVKTAPDYPKS